jgi:hypothetical protein
MYKLYCVLRFVIAMFVETSDFPGQRVSHRRQGFLDREWS